METIVTKELIFEYFSGKASPVQKKAVELWLEIDLNRDLYYHWLHEWETANVQLTSDWQKAYNRTKERIFGSLREIQPVKQPVARMTYLGKKIWLVAASITLVCVLGLWGASDLVIYQSVKTGYGETRKYVLPDGSAVVLNANSTIRFPRFGFSKTSPFLAAIGIPSGRNVDLKGEADFSVKHLQDHSRFAVNTEKGLKINVLGTQFTVFSRERGTQVVLLSGKVTLTNSKRTNEPALTMKPGDLATLSGMGGVIIRKIANPAGHSSWKAQRFTFEETSLKEIAQILTENYGLTVNIEGDGLAERTISGAFPSQNANELIKLVAEILQINYFRDGDTVTFSN